MEREDLANFYNKYGGAMRNVTECVPFCEKEDLYRIKEVVDSMIADGTLKRTPKYDKFQPKKLTDKQVISRATAFVLLVLSPGGLKTSKKRGNKVAGNILTTVSAL